MRTGDFVLEAIAGNGSRLWLQWLWAEKHLHGPLEWGGVAPFWVCRKTDRETAARAVRVSHTDIRHIRMAFVRSRSRVMR